MAKASPSFTEGGVDGAAAVALVVAEREDSPATLLPFCVTEKVTEVPARIMYLTFVNVLVFPDITGSKKGGM